MLEPDRDEEKVTTQATQERRKADRKKEGTTERRKGPKYAHKCCLERRASSFMIGLCCHDFHFFALFLLIFIKFISFMFSNNLHQISACFINFRSACHTNICTLVFILIIIVVRCSSCFFTYTMFQHVSFSIIFYYLSALQSHTPPKCHIWERLAREPCPLPRGILPHLASS